MLRGVISGTCEDACEPVAANDSGAVLTDEFRRLNGILTGVRIEGEAPVGKHRKRRVYVYCFHCKRSRRIVRLDSLKRPPKVGPDGKLRKAATSCGCLADKAFKRNMAAFAVHVPFGKKLKVWTQMKLGKRTEQVAEEFNLNKYLVGHVTKEIGRVAQSLKREAQVGGWLRMCGSVQSALAQAGEPAELSFRRKGRKWVSHMNSEFKRAKKIRKKWPFFAKSPVKEVRDILDLAAWVIHAHKAGMDKLRRRFKKRPTKVEALDRQLEKNWDLMLERINAERTSVSDIKSMVRDFVRDAENRVAPVKNRRSSK
jgi:hypothetical protein